MQVPDFVFFSLMLSLTLLHFVAITTGNSEQCICSLLLSVDRKTPNHHRNKCKLIVQTALLQWELSQKRYHGNPRGVRMLSTEDDCISLGYITPMKKFILGEQNGQDKKQNCVCWDCRHIRNELLSGRVLVLPLCLSPRTTNPPHYTVIS